MSGLPNNILKLRITSVTQETATAKTYQFEPVDGQRLPDFNPGQFLTFIFDTGKKEIRRSYSILSLSGEPLKVTVKKVVNGVVSRYILQHWMIGHVTSSLFPSGRFTLQPEHSVQRDIFCFAAGSGIVPILPQIRHLLIAEPQSIIHLIYSNHNESDTLFQKQIDTLSSSNVGLEVNYLFSEPAAKEHLRKRLSNISAEALINDLLTYRKEDAVFLICGPFAYMRMLTFTIGLMHFKKENIRKENFLTETLRSGAIAHPFYPATYVDIHLYGEKHIIRVNTGETILAAALRQGLRPPYSCEGGVCGTCVAKCSSGQVFMSINEVLLDNEIKSGLVLTCTGYPAAPNTSVAF
jgi:ring-1,2-phenylacetyl-CoA epoxidase subunit PaaE